MDLTIDLPEWTTLLLTRNVCRYCKQPILFANQAWLHDSLTTRYCWLIPSTPVAEPGLIEGSPEHIEELKRIIISRSDRHIINRG